MIFDCHTHIFPEHVVDRAMEALSARYGAAPVARATPEGLLGHMDECGVDRALVVAVATKPGQVASVNSWLLGLGEERLVPFGSLHPLCEDLEGEIARLVDAGVKGIKLQPHFQDFGLDDPRFLEMMECIGDRLWVLLHAGQEIAPLERIEPTPARLLALHRRFPAAKLILAHLGGYLEWEGVEELLVGQDLWLDASYVFDICPDDRIEGLIRAHGPERVVWGSDFPWQTQRQGLEGVARLRLSQEQKRGILGENLLRLLGM